MAAEEFRVQHSSYYMRKDLLKVDVVELLAPWVDRVSEVYGIKKKPAKYIVTYALAAIAMPMAQEIIDSVFKVLEDTDTFQGPPRPDPVILTNPEGCQPAEPRQVNFMDLVDYWASPINRTFGIGILQCRDVVKIVLTFFITDHFGPLAVAIEDLVKTPENELI